MNFTKVAFSNKTFYTKITNIHPEVVCFTNYIAIYKNKLNNKKKRENIIRKKNHKENLHLLTKSCTFRSFFFKNSLSHSLYSRQRASRRPSRESASVIAFDTFDVASDRPNIKLFIRVVRTFIASLSDIIEI